MFGRNKITMEKMKTIKPTSKLSLKMSCLAMADGDMERAEKIYDFFARDMELPDTDPTPPTTMEQVTEMAGKAYAFYKENQNEIAQAVGFFRSLRGKATPATPPMNIPELPK